MIEEGKRIPKTREGQDPDTHSDLYTDENPKGTIKGLGFKNKATAVASVKKIKNSGKKHRLRLQWNREHESQRKPKQLPSIEGTLNR